MAYIDRAKTVSWLTPQYVLDWAHEIMGVEEFDLDPACHPQSLVKAKKKFHGDGPDDDGFLQDWHQFGDFMFTNPPFGEKPPKDPVTKKVDPEYLKVFHKCSEWVRKYDVAAQRGMKIFAVLAAVTSNNWFHDYVATRSSAFCLLRKRIKFLSPQADGNPIPGENPGQAHMVVLWAHSDVKRIDRFYRTMEPHGLVVVPAGP